MNITINLDKIKTENQKIHVIKYYDRFKNTIESLVIYNEEELEQTKLIIAKRDYALLPEYEVLSFCLTKY